MQGSARGTALVLVAMAVPLLVLSVRRAARGSDAALVTWASALLYITYDAVLFLFLTPFNAAFLLCVALLGAALWSLGYLAANVGPREREHCGRRGPSALPAAMTAEQT